MRCVALGFGFGALACAKRIQILIPESYEHGVSVWRISLLDFLKRNCRQPSPLLARQKGTIHDAGGDFVLAVMTEEIQKHFRDFAGAKKNNGFHAAEEAMLWRATRSIFPLAFFGSASSMVIRFGTI